MSECKCKHVSLVLYGQECPTCGKTVSESLAASAGYAPGKIMTEEEYETRCRLYGDPPDANGEGGGIWDEMRGANATSQMRSAFIRRLAAELEQDPRGHEGALKRTLKGFAWPKKSKPIVVA